MILLYPETETAFENNGLGALSDTVSMKVTQELNGVYDLEMQYPISGIHYFEILNRRLLFVKPDPYHDPQPFSITQITKPLSGIVTIYARHIAYKLTGIVVSPFKASSCQSALIGLKENSSTENPFDFWTDKSTSAAFEVSVPSEVWSLLGGSEGSILDVYRGEYEFDRFSVKLWNKRGRDNGVTIRYGKNLTDLQQDENISNVVTGIYPYWKGSDGTLVELPEKIVNAPGTYNFQQIAPKDFTTDFKEQPTEEQLRERAQAYVKNNDIGIPAVSISVSFQPLEQTEEYKDLALLERVNLGDTVTVEYPNLGVSATARCVKTVYDVLKDRYESIELGQLKSNIAGTIANQQQQIQDFPNSTVFQQAVDNANGWITNGQKGEMVAIQKNGKWVEIASLDTGDIATAQSVWRWNNGGFGHSNTGYNGDFINALLADGSINAAVITTGILNANVIRAGIIKSLHEGGPYFDLDANNGQGELAASVLRGVGEESTTTARIGLGTYVGGGPYEGMRVATSSGAGGLVTIAIEREQRGEFTLSNAAEIVSNGDLMLRSSAAPGNPGGDNSINMTGNSTTGEGKIRIARGARSSSETVLLADNAQTNIAFNGRSALVATDDYTTIYKNGNPIFFGDDTNTYIRSTNGIIQFQTGGYASASIEKNGSAYFGYLYTNGTLVTSDRAKKKNIKAIRASALDMVKKAKAYEYVLKEDEKKRIGIMYDEAPECIRSDEERKAVDLYGMITLLWKAVQELEQKIDNIKEGKILST